MADIKGLFFYLSRDYSQVRKKQKVASRSPSHQVSLLFKNHVRFAVKDGQTNIYTHTFPFTISVSIEEVSSLMTDDRASQFWSGDQYSTCDCDSKCLGFGIIIPIKIYLPDK